MFSSVTKLAYKKRFAFNRDIGNNNIWCFELGVEIRLDVPFHVGMEARQREQLHQITHIKEAFHQPKASDAQFFISTEEILDAGRICEYEKGKFSRTL